MTTRIRNVDFDSFLPIAEWPAEAVAALLDRGSFDDWHLLAREIRRSPWGPVARLVESISEWGDHGSVDSLMNDLIEKNRAEVTANGRARHARRIRELRQSTGMSLREFAALVGTSAARMSAYERGHTSPTTDVLGRIEHAASIATDQDDSQP